MKKSLYLFALGFAAAVGAMLGDSVRPATSQAASVQVLMVCNGASTDGASPSPHYTDTCVTSPSDTSGETVTMTITQTGSLRYPVGSGGTLTIP